MVAVVVVVVMVMTIHFSITIVWRISCFLFSKYVFFRKKYIVTGASQGTTSKSDAQMQQVRRECHMETLW